MKAINFFVSVCKDKPQVEIDGKRYSSGFQGQVPVTYKIDGDVLRMDLQSCGHRPHVGGASHIKAVSVRICAKSITTIAIYDNDEMNSMGCCYCCNNGCCVYGNSDCGCG